MMKRMILIAIITIAALFGFGKFLESPPSAVDVITGATPKLNKNENTKLEGSYLLGMNTECISDEAARKVILNTAQNCNNDTLKDSIKLTVYIPDNEIGLKNYAERLDEVLNSFNADIEIVTFSSTMVYSKVMSGSYEVFLVPEDMLETEKIGNLDFIVLDSKDMR